MNLNEEGSSILEQQIKSYAEIFRALSEQYGEAVLSDYEDIIRGQSVE